MDKIESITIQGFQAHEDTRLDLDPGITTILGPSDTGKSSLVRAIRWAALNAHRGFDYLRHGCKSATVTLAGGGYVIERSRSGSQNSYSLSEVGFAPDQFDAVSGTVPPPISALLRIGEDNFQGQHDAPFWLSQSAGEVARALNKAVNLDSIDRHLSGAASFVKRASIEKDLTKESLTQARERYRALDFVDECASDAEVLGQHHSDCVYFESLIEKLLKYIVSIRAERAFLFETSDQLIDLEATVEAGAVWGRAERAVAALAALVSDAGATARVAALEVPDLAGLERAAKKMKDAAAAYNAFKAVVWDGLEFRNEVKAKTAEYEEAESKFKEQIKEGCPLCGK